MQRVCSSLGLLFLCHAWLVAAPLPVEQWQGLVPDPALTSPSGTPALAWPTPETTTTVTAQGLPADLSAVRSLRFWLHVAEPRDSVVTLVFGSENPASEGSDYYACTIKTDFTGWRQFLYARNELGTSRQPLGWDRIGRVFLSSNWAHHFDPATVVHLAGFVLDDQPLPGTEVPPGELLVNRGFELDRNYDGAPDGWGLGSFDSAAKIDCVEGGHEGKALRIQGADEGKCRAGASCSFGPDQADPQTLYVFSAWVKREGETGPGLGTTARFTSVGQPGEVLKSDYQSCPSGTYDWRPLHWLVRLAPETQRFNLVLFHHGPGTAWWDDVSLRRCRPGEALAPLPGAFVKDCQPTFQWRAPATAQGTLVVVGEGDPAFQQTFPVTGDSFRLPEPLPTGRTYRWYVLLDGQEIPEVTVFANDKEEPTMGSFFAGDWRAQARQMIGELGEFQAVYPRLKAFGDGAGMWDSFSLLGNLLSALDADELPQGTTVPDLLAGLNELRLRVPWWQKVFLDDAALFASLDLDLPGLETVRAAVAANDFPAARRAVHAYYVARRAPSYYRQWEKRPSLNPARTTDAKAEAYLTHLMPIHSYATPTYDVGRAFDWHIFPIVDVEWPTKIHRHFHWSSLAQGYWTTGNEAYANEIVQQMYDWGQDNPMERWDAKRYRWAWSTLNATIRIYSSWINGWLRIRESESWTPDAQFVMLTLLREHGQFLMTNKTRAGQGNWAVAEARGLVELGIMFPEFKEAAEWRAEGFRRLATDIDLQVLADGVHVERTPGYHSMTLSCFMEPLRLALLNQVPFEGREHFLAQIEKMYEFYLYGCDPNRRMAQIGDGHQMSVVPRMTEGAEMFGREDMRYVATEGKEGVVPIHRSYGFTAAGFYVSRSAWNDPQALWSIMDWGGFQGHCHEDMGQICLRAYGKPILIDSGIYSYAFPMRSYFHWTVGHNTLMVDEQPQKRRDPLSSTWVTTDRFDYVRGLTDNSEPVLHERSLVFKQPGTDGPGYWVVLDRVTGEGSHRLDQRWHPNEKFKGTVTGPNVVFTSAAAADPQPSLVLAALPAGNLQTAVVEGAVSYEWYKKIPVDVAQFTRECEVPAVLATVLYPTLGQPAQVTVERLPATLDGQEAAENVATAFAVTIVDGGQTYRDTWLFRHGDTGVLQAGGVTLDGRVAWVRDGQAWLVVEGTRLQVGGQALFTAAEPMLGISRVGQILACTDGKEVRVASDDPLAVNGGEPVAPANGVVVLATVAAPTVSPIPRRDGPMNFEIAPPPEAIPATGFARMLAKDAHLPPNAVVANAADITGQGGGTIEITEKKIGAQGKAFLHWDAAGHWLEYTLTVPAGRYALWLRACTSEGAVLRKITVAGQTPEAASAQEIAGTGGYSSGQDDWRILVVADKDAHDLAFDLPAGPVTLRLENLDGESLNLNWLALVPVQP